MGGLCLKLLPFQFKGLPDRICLLPGGIIFFVELKSPGEDLTKMQQFVIGKIKTLGFNVYIIDTIEQILEIWKEQNI